MTSKKDDELERCFNIISEIKVPTRFFDHKDIFQKLHKLLSNDNPFASGFNHNYCKYVNFFLNNIINPLYSDEDKKEYFSLFNKFGTKLKELRSTNSTCVPYLHYIDPEILTRMNSLYNLYNKYNTLANSKKSQAEFPCDEHTIFRVLYNDTIIRYDGKENNVIEKLIHLKKLIKENIFSPNTEMCGEEVTKYYEPINYLKEKENKRLEALEEEKRQKLQQEQQLQQQQQQQQQQKQQQLQEQIKESSGYNPTRTGEETELHVPFLSSNQQVQGDPVRREQSRAHVNTVHPVLPEYSGIRQGETFSFGHDMGQNEIDKYDTGYPTRGKNEESDYFGKVQGFFTETLGQVEPAPILGVSGGMGALFLLFKYTPVGSFFGGRRRRFRQIPSSFRGFPPDFANFQDYDGGFIGYGPMNINPLAE
ncbi:hypothetical protein PVBG_06089 [Plasmodium vivax Brazil I]|uniref:VIR protein n=1 Tax=Plasmodium vivax (strain Brazil I) TaxID=1033975 RepID=A0A0J9T260_PLAV1|nr:hypothetical protein PVBG_06089 [Plasmodium vivax Brazil I]